MIYWWQIQRTNNIKKHNYTQTNKKNVWTGKIENTIDSKKCLIKISNKVTICYGNAKKTKYYYILSTPNAGFLNSKVICKFNEWHKPYTSFTLHIFSEQVPLKS